MSHGYVAPGAAGTHPLPDVVAFPVSVDANGISSSNEERSFLIIPLVPMFREGLPKLYRMLPRKT